jgi:hypothetical protein
MMGGMCEKWVVMVLFLFCAEKGLAQEEISWPPTAQEQIGFWSAGQPKTYIKFDVINLARIIEPRAVRGLFFVAVERRIGVKWSLNTEAGAGYRFSWQKNQMGLAALPNGLNISVAARRYSHVPDRILAGDHPEAMNGGYLACMVTTGIFPESDPGRANQSRLWYPKFVAFSPYWGIQRAIFGVGYVDFGVGIKACYGYDDPFQVPMAFVADKPARFRIQPMSNLRVGLCR